MPRERVLTLEGNAFIENTKPRAQLIGKADVQDNILDLFAKGPKTQTQFAAALGLDQSNTSTNCARLEGRRLIKRYRLGQPWQLLTDEEQLDAQAKCTPTAPAALISLVELAQLVHLLPP